MTESGSTTRLIEGHLQRVIDGDREAIDDLISVAFERLIGLCERIVGGMLSGRNAHVHQSDVFQEAFFRLKNALTKDNVTPATLGEFMGLAARHIRFQVLDMLRAGKKGGQISGEDTLLDIASPPTAPDDDALELWITFYEAIGELPEPEQQVAELLWTWRENNTGPATPGLSQSEAAEVLGISRDRVKDLWRNAKIHIARKCRDFAPFEA